MARKKATRRRQRKHLLQQHLEGISWKILGEYPDIVRELIRRRSGVYALYRKNKLYYVGLANNLMGRINAHLRDRHHGSWDRFSVYLTAKADHMKELESLVLRLVNPSGNIQSGKFARSENLLPVLNRHMSEYDADRRARLLGGPFARRRRRAKTARSKGTLVLAGVVERRIPLRAWRDKEEFKASLWADGKIRFRKKAYEAPTAATRAATGTTRNGWTFWHYRDERGEWVPLKHLRR
jgi:hypothetical protein